MVFMRKSKPWKTKYQGSYENALVQSFLWPALLQTRSRGWPLKGFGMVAPDNQVLELDHFQALDEGILVAALKSTGYFFPISISPKVRCKRKCLSLPFNWSEWIPPKSGFWTVHPSYGINGISNRHQTTFPPASLKSQTISIRQSTDHRPSLGTWVKT